ncbi:hypothetical protein EOA75_03105 [Mesorhizobium sp. M1A.F.Ca.IN.022.07.1.1]|uniref:hypothetical protein n=1 Tax=unclassified Mesorhizobium TaxID=325217 RepID=UPI000FCAF94D|nr:MULTISPECIES: hypothetical protein [unclassified Mesorhizobium]TGV93019.1 hypothetical protein EN801_007875 [Mesorhizobium sp. M00.F.Ca.ET.158.01.1.1]RUV27502.1 hypothetical protein EOA91_00425 [Mesorhizobium sp. M1A.F.Ca.IN.022.04.1.1]RUV97588.1 hypothetical protein EOA75_03105 [Mesorhizobium sp. M1A.F.Ca.IN.022.07.1.1]RWG07954.1 MAG: hypothetical protein EOQ54_01560 [Mesorhizobium sp.]RWG32181.1 MAG: hypothetical protein EOQ60_14500 [Mesorhizobium sp.]
MIEISNALATKLTGLQERLRAANVSMDDMQAFQRVADHMDNGRGGIDADDLIALSFVMSDDAERSQMETAPAIEPAAHRQHRSVGLSRGAKGTGYIVPPKAG